MSYGEVKKSGTDYDVMETVNRASQQLMDYWLAMTALALGDPSKLSDQQLDDLTQRVQLSLPPAGIDESLQVARRRIRQAAA